MIFIFLPRTKNESSKIDFRSLLSYAEKMAKFLVGLEHTINWDSNKKILSDISRSNNADEKFFHVFSTQKHAYEVFF